MMRGAAWRVRLQLLLFGVLMLALGFGTGWTAHWLEQPAGEPRPGTGPTPLPASPAPPAPAVARLAPTPMCGPKGLTKTDIRLACYEGWMRTEEAALVGLNADCGHSDGLPADDVVALRWSEDQAVAELAKSGPQERLCAPTAISADAVRLACRAHEISPDFARLLGVDARAARSWRSLCELAPAEAAALERHEAAAVKSR